MSYGPPPPQAANQASQAPQQAAAPPPPPPAAEKTEFTVRLVKMDEGAKYKVLKEIRVFKPGMSVPDVRTELNYSCYYMNIIPIITIILK